MPPDPFTSLITTLTTTVTAMAVPLAVLSMIILGCFLAVSIIWPRFVQERRGHFWGICAGLMLVTAAPTLVTWLAALK